MYTPSKKEFKDILHDIQAKNIALPDFQRGLVWDVNEVKLLLASVLAALPVGSVLLLEADIDDYACRQIGCSSKVTYEKPKGVQTVYMLLDGQQRLTTLTNCFTNLIFSYAQKTRELANSSLKNRYFLRIDESEDLFGFRKLEFPFEPGNNPTFLSSQVKECIEVRSFKQDDSFEKNRIYFNPWSLPDNDIVIKECVHDRLIPLYLSLNVLNDECEFDSSLIIQSVIEGIATQRKDTLITNYKALQSDDEKIGYALEYANGNGKTILSVEQFQQQIKLKSKKWQAKLLQYIQKCSEMEMSVISVASSDRARAIDIYEQMNKGGHSLSTFDLLCAKAANGVSKEPLPERISQATTDKKHRTDYSEKLLDSVQSRNQLKAYLQTPEGKRYNASIYMGMLKDGDSLTPLFCDVFQNVLALYARNPIVNDSSSNVLPTAISSSTILTLSEKEINKNYKTVCRAINRANFFFQARCGVTKSSDVSYKLMLTLVGYLFCNDEIYTAKTMEILEAWYWSSLFSGTYDSHPVDHFIEDLNHLRRTLANPCAAAIAWLDLRRKDVLNKPMFSDCEFLSLAKVGEHEQVPKKDIGNWLCQFLLARTYLDLDTKLQKGKKQIRVSPFIPIDQQLDKHHLLPLGSASASQNSNTLGNEQDALTKAERNNPANIYNSPLNFLLITKKANLNISQSDWAAYSCYINAYSLPDIAVASGAMGCVQTPLKFLEERHAAFKKMIDEQIDNMISAFL